MNDESGVESSESAKTKKWFLKKIGLNRMKKLFHKKDASSSSATAGDDLDASPPSEEGDDPFSSPPPEAVHGLNESSEEEIQKEEYHKVENIEAQPQERGMTNEWGYEHLYPQHHYHNNPWTTTDWAAAPVAPPQSSPAPLSCSHGYMETGEHLFSDDNVNGCNIM